MVRAALRDLIPLHADAAAYLFTNAKNGGPIDHHEWVKGHWWRCLRALGIRPRKFYATRHTFISVALTKGTKVKWLTEYCGTSVAMVEKHYGKFLDGEAEAQLALLADAIPAPAEVRVQAARGANRQPYGGGCRFVPKNPYGIKRP